MDLSLHTNNTSKIVIENIVIETRDNESITTHYDVVNGEPTNPKIINPIEYIENKFSHSNSTNIIDERILVNTSALLVWQYTPNTDQILNVKNGSKFLLQKHKWNNFIFKLQHNKLYIATTQFKKRVNANTRLYHAPLPNVSSNGIICLGNLELPETRNIDQISKAYFDSLKTHLNNNYIFRNKTTNDTEFYKILNEKLKTRTGFKVSELNIFGTVEQFIKGRK